MSRRMMVSLFLLGIAIPGSVGAFQSAPGYMDAEYYYATSLQLAGGQGFTEPFLWNYLDDPQGLPHPSHVYWLPLTSLLAALGMSLSGNSSFVGAKIGFIVLAGLIPPLTAGIVYALTEKRYSALLAGLFGIFSVFYLPYFPTTDTFGLYMIFGGLFFLLPTSIKNDLARNMIYGIIAGLMYLTRADALLWLLVAFVMASYRNVIRKTFDNLRFTFHVSRFTLVLIGFFLIAVPWLIRNQLVFGTPFSPGGEKALWFTSYDQLFAYPADQVGFDQWWASGLAEIIRVRLWALGQNLQTAIAVQGSIFLVPFILAGGWHLRKDFRAQVGALAWLITLAAMTLAFPFAGARGGFFHSGAALQPLLWALAAVGLEEFLSWGSRVRGWHIGQARRVFASALVGFALALSIFVFGQRVIGWGAGGQMWGGGQETYRRLDDILLKLDISRSEIIMVNNPPGFYIASGRPAIVIPDGDEGTLLSAAQRYQAKYVILEFNHPQGLNDLYGHPDQNPALQLLWSDDDIYFFVFTE
ncbi:MAG: hypothetical protein FJ010_06090 [Chloroflexi bacterium]|nr:hypothetical protein [Chloroflexota bacterium]